MKRKPAKTSKSKKFKFNCPICDPNAKTRPWFVMIGLSLLVIAASLMVVNFK